MPRPAPGRYPVPMSDPRLRVSDADRNLVVAELEQHAAAGRLDLDEYAERVDRALVARTFGDLGAVTADLPADGAGVTDREDSRHLLLAFLLAALVVIGFAVVLGLAR